MNATSPFPLLAALTDAGVLWHDIFGVITLAVLLVIGILFFRHQHRWAGGNPQVPETNMDRKFGRIQLWVLYWVAIAAAIGFFFVMPRATSQRAQREPGETRLP
ncbi:MAG: hypothetical protein JWR15_3608 [Prosthecobacter sp.]|nr:hypothetical protein [Prosthecobacter sp.]